MLKLFLQESLTITLDRMESVSLLASAQQLHLLQQTNQVNSNMSLFFQDDVYSGNGFTHIH